MSYIGVPNKYPSVDHTASPRVLTSAGWVWTPSENTNGVDLDLATLDVNGSSGAFVVLYLEVSGAPQQSENRILTQLGSLAGAHDKSTTIQGLRFAAGVGVYANIQSGFVHARINIL